MNGKTTKPRVSQGTLAEMIGTTRSRVNFFMNKSRKLGMIAYDKKSASEFAVHSSLARVLERD